MNELMNELILPLICILCLPIFFVGLAIISTCIDGVLLNNQDATTHDDTRDAGMRY
jgi:uncharacterized membrane protein YvlD (DUF360 family)